MEKTKIRTYYLDGDTLNAALRYDELSGLWIEEYIDFESIPRYTPNGKPWKSVTTTDCPYSDPVYRDCGTCPHLIKEKPTDLIGVCNHEHLRKGFKTPIRAPSPEPA